jgi:hypothetical protein
MIRDHDFKWLEPNSRIRVSSGKFIVAVSGAGTALLILVASSTGSANAQVNCEAIAAGPARTDCYIGLGRIAGQSSEVAAGTAHQHTDRASYRQSTGRRPKTKGHRALPGR